MRVYVVARATGAHGHGGMERVTEDLVGVLVEAGHDVTVLTTAIAGRDRPAPSPTGGGRLTVEHLPSRRPGRHSVRWTRALRSYLEEQDDLGSAVVLSVSSGAVGVAALARRRGATVVMHAHGTSVIELRSRRNAPGLLAKAKAAKNVWWLPRDLLLYRRCDVVVSAAPAITASLGPLLRLSRSRALLREIPNGVVTPPPEVLDGRPEWREALGWATGTAVVLSASRLDPQKGIDRAIRAISWIHDQEGAPEVLLAIAGVGPAEAGLRALAAERGVEDRVVFLGRLPHEQLQRAMVAADVLVALGQRESLGLSVLEAAACGLPQVVSADAAESLPRMSSLHVVDAVRAEAVGPALLAASAAPRQPCLPREFGEAAFTAGFRDLLDEICRDRR